MINSRAALCVFLLTAALIMLAGKARSADSPRLPAGYNCEQVRENVKRYGYWLSLAWARANGFTTEQIEQAKRCLRK